eukprot:Lithocolla_globosa_v1_NODE_538_length_3793_cov_198.788235.p1 type:complete len:860 gc:universal NODE_538_length_3793_cov_198.788235:2774-195(-)
MKSLIMFPTRTTSTSDTLIDHIFTNNSTKHVTAGIIYGDIADHIPTFCIYNDIHTYFKEPVNRLSYDTKNYIQEDFKKELKVTKFSSILQKKDPNSAFTEFMDIFSPISHKHIPSKNSKCKHKTSQARKEWITSELKKKIKKQHTLYEQSQKQPQNTEVKQEHSKYKNKLRKEIKKAKRQYYEDEFTKHLSNSKKTWEIIKNILQNRRTQKIPKQVIVSKDNKNIIINNQKEVANEFNKFFTTVASELVNKIKNSQGDKPPKSKTFRDYIDKNSSTCFRFNRTTSKAIEKLLKQLDPTKAIGTDRIHTITLIDGAETIAPYICFIFNLSIRTGSFPNDLKPARVVPLYKKGDPFMIPNYRPVSILITLSKIFERLIHEQLTDFFHSNNLFSKSQYGFLKNRNTTTALIDFYEELLQILDQMGMTALVTFIDLAKAFDTVNHDILFAKLEMYGVYGPALKIIKSYFTARYQTVIIDGVESDPMLITCGVPQGSILGPLFFIIYINDLANSLKNSKPFMFADDTTLMTLNKDIFSLRKDSLQDLYNISNWCDASLLSLNASKTAYLLMSSHHKHLPDSFPTDNLPPVPPQITKTSTRSETKKENGNTIKTTITTKNIQITQAITKQIITHTITSQNNSSFTTEPYTITTNTNPLNLTINNTHIKMEEHVRFLGVEVHENVKWNIQVQKVVKKITKFLGIFCKLRYCCPQKILIQLYYSFIYSHLIYCIEVWGNCNTNAIYLKPLLILQKKLVRIMTFANYNTHASPIFSKLKIMNIYDIYKYRISLLAHKYVYGKTMFTPQKTSFASNIHDHDTRSSSKNKLYVNHYRTYSFGQQTISHKITKAWNSLLTELSEIEKHTIF